MNRKRKKIKKVREEEDIFEKLDTQNRALMKILKKLKNGRQKKIITIIIDNLKIVKNEKILRC